MRPMKRASSWMSSFIKEVYSQFVESEGVDEDHEILQIIAETSEAEGGSSIGGSGRRLLRFLWGWSRLRGKTETRRKRPVLRPKTFPSQSWIAAGWASMTLLLYCSTWSWSDIWIVAEDGQGWRPLYVLCCTTACRFRRRGDPKQFLHHHLT